ncbi:MAG: helix-turn-helix transcriptional regulator [Thermoanaerobaculia bacterium]|nr:helix-turn-helix transcriptional regulator [Thermoanaerobaculia bacterium]
MRFEGRVWKDGKFWLIEVPALEAITQGRTKAEALVMVKDLLETMANEPGFEAQVEAMSGDRFEVTANDAKTLVALLLRRQREVQGLTLAEAAQRLQQTSRNAYARYEQGKAMPTVEKLEELLNAVVPGKRLVWRLAS